MDIDYTGLECGNESEQETGHKREAEGKCEYSPIETYFFRTGNRIRTYVEN